MGTVSKGCYMDDLNNASAVITGASSGIGEQAARLLAREGANVVLAARRGETLEAIANDIEDTHDVEGVANPTDISQEAACESLIEETVERFGEIDILVNNAGVGLGADVAEMATEDYRTMMAVNTDGYFFTTRAALPHLSDEGHLIYVGSIAGEYPRPFNPVYAATKWWVRGFAKSVAAQYGGDGIAVTVVNPSEVRSEFGSEDGPPFKDRFEPGTASEPADVAESIVFAAKAGHTAPLEIGIYRRDKFADTF